MFGGGEPLIMTLRASSLLSNTEVDTFCLGNVSLMSVSREACTIESWMSTSWPQKQHWRWFMSEKKQPVQQRSGSRRSTLRSWFGWASLCTLNQKTARFREYMRMKILPEICTIILTNYKKHLTPTGVPLLSTEFFVYFRIKHLVHLIKYDLFVNFFLFIYLFLNRCLCLDAPAHPVLDWLWHGRMPIIVIKISLCKYRSFCINMRLTDGLLIDHISASENVTVVCCHLRSCFWIRHPQGRNNHKTAYWLKPFTIYTCQ